MARGNPWFNYKKKSVFCEFNYKKNSEQYTTSRMIGYFVSLPYEEDIMKSCFNLVEIYNMKYLKLGVVTGYVYEI